MSTRQRVRCLLERTPFLSSREIAASLEMSQRHVRRLLAGMPEVTAHQEGRAVTYTITTTDPENFDGPRGSDRILEGIADIDGFAALMDRGLMAAELEWIFPGDSGSGESDNNGDGGHDAPDRAVFQDLQGPECNAFADRQDARYGDDPIAAQSEEIRACRSCPLTLASLERDTIQFVIVDKVFRDLLLRQAKAKGWTMKTRQRSLFIYRPHLTLQVGADAVVFSSDEPGDLEWICEWVREEFGAHYLEIDSLVSRIRSPSTLTRDELTVVVSDTKTIDAILDSIGMQMKKGVFYLKSPNQNTPGFKAYQHKDTLRCEFDARNGFQAIAALGMRQRLLTILGEVRKYPGLFWEFLTDYYNPYEHPIIIDTGMSEFSKVIQILVEKMMEINRVTLLNNSRFLDNNKKSSNEGNYRASKSKISSIIDSLNKMSDWNQEFISSRMRDELSLSLESVHTFFVAWSKWCSMNFHGSVLVEDIIETFEYQGLSVDISSVMDNIERLKISGLLQNDDKLEICFSKEGIRLGKKLMAKWKNNS
ncbi:hypothetical protein [Methanocalculus sp.]|uniref:hypothetical protein n=1 Tax=Methanocalculus sp. TaxID=2004547 RepID=UPI002623083C|nr:hypothetical protein [Methanocalculus sp.]MDG6250471.1 hypothetical protein [Methanocalculus sp.]